ncbi:hypothetical protein MRB53_041524 [Persea americana]|nr:hypothetical protein MRB53_041524 [Persea americana]
MNVTDASGSSESMEKNRRSIRGDSDVYDRPTFTPWRASISSRRSSARRHSLILQRAPDKRTWWKFTLRDWDDDDPQDWWFASIAIPLLAATIGPLANVSSIAALVVYWRECVSADADYSTDDGATICAWNGDYADILPDTQGVSYADPRWCYWLNVASLIVAFLGNLALLCNFTRRIRYIIALPVTIIAWFLASGILMGITIAMAVYVPPTAPQQVYSQGYWHAVMAAILYFFCSVLLLINMIGYFLGHYPQNFTLTDAQRTLILQTMMFFIWLAGGAGIFSALESRGDSGAAALGFNFNYSNALYFCDVTVLTIGFGDLFPTSDAAKGILIPYAIGGIVTLGLMVTSLAKFAGEIGSDKIIYRHIERSRTRTLGRTVTSSMEMEDRRQLNLDERPEISAPIDQHRTATIKIADNKEDRSDFPSQRQGPMLQRTPTLPRLQRAATLPLQRVASMVNRPRVPKLILLREEKDRFQAMREIQAETEKFKKWSALGMSVIAFGILWCVGAVVFWEAEMSLQHLNYFEALYFCYVSLLTIGYGDLAPKSNPGRAFFVVWSLIAIPTITLLISHLGDTIIDNFKEMTNAVADFTVLPQEGAWRKWIESHPKVMAWLQHRKEKKATQRRIEEGLPVGPDPIDDAPEAPTIDELAHEKLSHQDLARRLARAIKQTAKDAKEQPDKQYGYEEWVEFTRLIRFTAKNVDDVELDEEEGMVEWDWIGEDSPMMAKGTEADFLLARLIESMHRYITRIATIPKMPAAPPTTIFHTASSSSGQKTQVDSGENEDEKDDGLVISTMSSGASVADIDHIGPRGERRGRDAEDSASLTISMTKRHATYQDND